MIPAASLRPTPGWTFRRPGRGRRPARGAVAWALAAALAVHAWMAVAVETTRPEWRDPEFYHRLRRVREFVRWEAENGAGRPLVVVLGSSRPQMGLSPEHLGLGVAPADPLVFNCSQSACHPIGERLNLARLLDAGITPDFLLVEVLPALLADTRPPEASLPVHRLGHADLARLRPLLADPGRVRREWAETRLLTWHSLRHSLQPHLFGRDLIPEARRDDFLWADARTFGWGPFAPAEWPDEVRAARVAADRRAYAPMLATFHVAPGPDRAYRALLAECRAKGVRAALFVMPESPAFREWYPPGARKEAADYLARLSREYEVPVFDAAEWVPAPAAYMDSHHLLGPAAEAFSARFGRECVGPWVRAARSP